MGSGQRVLTLCSGFPYRQRENCGSTEDEGQAVTLALGNARWGMLKWPSQVIARLKELEQGHGGASKQGCTRHHVHFGDI